MGEKIKETVKALQEEIHATDTCIMGFIEMACKHCPRSDADYNRNLIRLEGSWQKVKACLELMLDWKI